MFDAGLDKKFWAKATNTTVYLHNRIIASRLEGKYLMKCGQNKARSYSFENFLVASVPIHVAKEKSQKCDKKSTEYILVGYLKNVKKHKIYNCVTKAVTTGRNIVVIKHEKNKVTVRLD